MDGKIINQQNFYKEIKPGVTIEHILKGVTEIYTSEAGWEIGQFHLEDANGNIIPLGSNYEGKKYIVIPLTQYEIENSRIR